MWGVNLRREFFRFVGGGAALWPLRLSAQQGERMRRIGVLFPMAADDPLIQARYGAFLQGLQELGWMIGRNVQIDARWAPTAADVRKYAGELVALIPGPIDQNRCAHWRNPMDMIRQG